jgi:hypothetical protein
MRASSAFGVVELAPEEFLRAITLDPEPMIVQAESRSFWGKRSGSFRYLASIKGITLFAEAKAGPFKLPDSAIVIEAESIKVPKDL